jgi:tetraacyldisaccharide 4'-kinase
MGRDETGARARLADTLPVLRARLTADAAVARGLQGNGVLAFAGIGRPEKFFRTLRHLGAAVEVSRAFSDHHAFTDSQLRALLARAGSLALTPVTTEKDAVRLPAWARAQVTVLSVAVTWDDPAAVDELLDTALGHGGS